MKNNAPKWVVLGSAVLVSATTAGGLSLAEEQPPSSALPVHIIGLINDYTPSAAVSKGGPYEMRGKWSLDIDERRGPARFSAAMNMETSDYGIVQFTVNGTRIGAPIDGFADSVKSTGAIDLGEADLKKGPNTLRVEVVGTNPDSRPPRYAFGLDCVVLKRSP